MYIALSEALDRVLRFASARLVASSDSSIGAPRSRPRRVSSRPLSAWEVPRLPDAATALTPDPAQPPTRHRSARGHKTRRFASLLPSSASFVSSVALVPSCPSARALPHALCFATLASSFILRPRFLVPSRPLSPTMRSSAIVFVAALVSSVVAAPVALAPRTSTTCVRPRARCDPLTRPVARLLGLQPEPERPGRPRPDRAGRPLGDC